MTSEVKNTANSDGRCPICEESEYVARFQVPFPSHSRHGHRAFPLNKKLEVPAWTIVKCLGCTAHYPNPYPRREEIDQYYASQTESGEWEKKYYVEVAPEVREQWRFFADQLSRLRGGGTGSSIGDRLRRRLAA